MVGSHIGGPVAIKASRNHLGPSVAAPLAQTSVPGYLPSLGRAEPCNFLVRGGVRWGFFHFDASFGLFVFVDIFIDGYCAIGLQ